MPQMAPMNWIILYIFFSFMFIMFNFVNFYLFLIKNKYNQITDMKINLFSWKW
uniref:ATP synthase F0 subunit 8 n=1 Tax=Neoporus sp. NHM-IR594 TaxID=2714628 RepID=A0A894JQV4_9DYTI|nr:ATP synthase F0 subunit 8 [Neoporus sp. NHM-IR594]